MGDSLRANAERLLRDVQALHGQMISRIEVVEASRQAAAVDRSAAERPAPAPSGRARSRKARGREAGGDDDDIDVPEFIPRR
jgi:hypothetical protein